VQFLLMAVGLLCGLSSLAFFGSYLLEALGAASGDGPTRRRAARGRLQSGASSLDRATALEATGEAGGEKAGGEEAGGESVLPLVPPSRRLRHPSSAHSRQRCVRMGADAADADGGQAEGAVACRGLLRLLPRGVRQWLQSQSAVLSFGLSVAALSCIWYSCSIALVTMNRLVLGFGGARFRLPLLITVSHMAVKGLLAAGAVAATMSGRARSHRRRRQSTASASGAGDGAEAAAAGDNAVDAASLSVSLGLAALPPLPPAPDSDATAPTATAPGAAGGTHATHMGPPSAAEGATTGLLRSPPSTPTHPGAGGPQSRLQRALFTCGALRDFIADQQRLSWHVFWTLQVPLGVATALDVWFSNEALRHIDVSVYTIVKASGLVFTMLFSWVSGLGKPTVALAATVLGISTGIALTAADKAHGLSATGLVFAFAAAMSSAFRWVSTEKYYDRPGVTANPLVLMCLVAPVTVVALLPAFGAELPRIVAHPPVQSPADALLLAVITLGGGALAFLLLLVELQLVGMSSALTLNVIGHMKDVAVIGLAIPVFHEHLSPMNAVGVAITVLSAALYSCLKKKQFNVRGSSRRFARRVRSGFDALLAAVAANRTGGMRWQRQWRKAHALIESAGKPALVFPASTASKVSVSTPDIAKHRFLQGAAPRIASATPQNFRVTGANRTSGVDEEIDVDLPGSALAAASSSVLRSARSRRCNDRTTSDTSSLESALENEGDLDLGDTSAWNDANTIAEGNPRGSPGRARQSVLFVVTDADEDDRDMNGQRQGSQENLRRKHVALNEYDSVDDSEARPDSFRDGNAQTVVDDIESLGSEVFVDARSSHRLSLSWHSRRNVLSPMLQPSAFSPPPASRHDLEYSETLTEMERSAKRLSGRVSQLSARTRIKLQKWATPGALKRSRRKNNEAEDAEDERLVLQSFSVEAEPGIPSEVFCAKIGQ
jgi:drug/metabolite transporter (DMT)-like permease